VTLSGHESFFLGAAVTAYRGREREEEREKSEFQD